MFYYISFHNIQVVAFNFETQQYSDSCYTGRGIDYRGTANIATGGDGETYECLKWTSQTAIVNNWTVEDYPEGGLGDHNYCRNPDHNYRGLWCVTAEEPYYKYCTAIPECTEG